MVKKLAIVIFIGIVIGFLLARISNGAQSDPKAYFFKVVEGESASNWQVVLREVQNDFYKVGWGQQADSSGNVRGRLFLPHASCLNAAPRTPEEVKLGVNQTPACWEHPVDVVENNQWVWIDRGGPPYIPLVPTPEPPPTNDCNELKLLAAKLVTDNQRLTDNLTECNNQLNDCQKQKEALQYKLDHVSCKASIFRIPIPCTVVK